MAFNSEFSSKIYISINHELKINEHCISKVLTLFSFIWRQCKQTWVCLLYETYGCCFIQLRVEQNIALLDNNFIHKHLKAGENCWFRLPFTENLFRNGTKFAWINKNRINKGQKRLIRLWFIIGYNFMIVCFGLCSCLFFLNLSFRSWIHSKYWFQF